jgi:hypothetical protein
MMSATAAAPSYTVDGCEPAAFSNGPAPKTAMPYPTWEIQIRPPATEAAIPVDSNLCETDYPWEERRASQSVQAMREPYLLRAAPSRK